MSDYKELSQLENAVIGEYRARILNNPAQEHSDKICYEIELVPENGSHDTRTLRLWLSDISLHHHSGGQYQRRVLNCIEQWLATGNLERGEIECMGN